MPHYRFTLLMALAIVLCYGLALLWPDGVAQVWGWRAMVCLPLVLAIFMWSAVRGAAPLDDRAFHRTLPPGDGVAFRKVLGIAALVPLGIALVVMWYCWKSGFGWRPLTLGLAMLTVPVIGALSVLGLTASLATSRSYSRIWPWLWIFGVPVFSACGMNFLSEGLDPELGRDVYFTHWRTIAVSGAVLYPLIWWLIAARRRIVWGMALATVLGILMPWLYHYGDLGPELAGYRDTAGRQGEGANPVYAGQIRFVRKPLPPGASSQDTGIDWADLIKIEGMKEGEFMLYASFQTGRKENFDRNFLRCWEIAEGADGARKWNRSSLTASRKEDGQATFGREAVWSALSQRLPYRFPLRSWRESNGLDQTLGQSPRAVTLPPGADPGDEQKTGYHGKSRPAPESGDPPGDDELKREWSVRAWIYRFEGPMSFPVNRGGTTELPGSGLVKMNSLAKGGSVISFDLIREELWQADGPWPGKEKMRLGFEEPWVFLVDREQGRTYVIDRLHWNSEERMVLGARGRMWFQAGPPDSPEMVKRLERLPHCEIYLFWPRFAGRVEQSLEGQK